MDNMKESSIFSFVIMRGQKGVNMERFYRNGYYHNTMKVEIKNLSKVLLELGSNKDVFGIDVLYIGVGDEPIAIVKFGSNN